MLPRNDPDRIQIAFDDHRLVSNAGLILPSTWTTHGWNAPDAISWWTSLAICATICGADSWAT